MRGTPSPLLAIVVSVLLALGACSSGDDDDASTTSTTADGTVPTEGAPDPDDPVTTPTAGVDACTLLDAATLEDLVAFEFGAGTWTAEDGPDGSCSWTNDEQLTTITVEVRDGVEETLDELRAGSGTELEDVDVGATTATGVRDVDADRLGSLYVPAGADTIVKITQSPLKVSDEDLVAVAERAALAFENLPVADDDRGAPGGSAAGTTEGLEAVAFTIQSADADIDLSFEVTAEEVRAAASPVTTMAICAGVEAGDTGIFEGLYVVSGTDLDRESGLVSVSIESLDAVDGPGTYRGRLSANDSAGRNVEVDGDLTIDASMRSGELIGEDGSGNQVAATFECRPVG